MLVRCGLFGKQPNPAYSFSQKYLTHFCSQLFLNEDLCCSYLLTITQGWNSRPAAAHNVSPTAENTSSFIIPKH